MKKAHCWFSARFFSLIAIGLLGQRVAAEVQEPAPALPADAQPKAELREPDVIYVPTPQIVVDKMLEMAQIGPGDVVYDLGCGDGRIVVTAARKYKVRAKGFDIDPERVRESRANVAANGVQHLATIEQADIFKLDLREATVVTLYLLPELNVQLMPQLAKLRPGARILSHDFDMEGTKPAQIESMRAPDEDGLEEEHTIYKWIVPWEKALPKNE